MIVFPSVESLGGEREFEDNYVSSSLEKMLNCVIWGGLFLLYNIYICVIIYVCVITWLILTIVYLNISKFLSLMFKYMSEYYHQSFLNHFLFVDYLVLPSFLINGKRRNNSPQVRWSLKKPDHSQHRQHHHTNVDWVATACDAWLRRVQLLGLSSFSTTSSRTDMMRIHPTV